MELQRAAEGRKKLWRIFTHFGKTSDLHSNNIRSGTQQCRYLDSEKQARVRNSCFLVTSIEFFFFEVMYDLIYRAKAAEEKGYQSVDLLSTTNIGSEQLKSHIESSSRSSARKRKRVDMDPSWMTLSPKVKELVNKLYVEARNCLTAKIQAKITSRGIETPLGILTMNQIEKGENALDLIAASFVTVEFLYRAFSC